MKKILLSLILCFTVLSVSAQHGWYRNFQDASDVDKTAPADEQGIFWDDTLQLWVPTTMDDILDSVYLRLDCTNDPLTAALDIAPDTDIVNSFGKWKMGYDGTNADSATLSHYDNMAWNTFALSQDASANTYLNGADMTYFMTNGITKIRLYPSGGDDRFHLVTDVDLCLGGGLGSERVFFEQSGTNPTLLTMSTPYSNLGLVVQGEITATEYNDIVVVDTATYGFTDEAIQAAITAIGSGGEIKMPEGDYTCDAKITVDGSVVTDPLLIRGVGAKTNLNFTQTDGTDGIEFLGTVAQDIAENWGITLRDFKITGNASMGDGIYMNKVGRGKMENVTVTGVGAYGVYIETGLNYGIETCFFDENGTGGIILIDVHDISLIGVQAEANTFSGIYILNCFEVSVIGCSPEDNNSSGIYIYNTSGLQFYGICSITGNALEGNLNHGILIDGVNNVIINGNIFGNNAQDGINLNDSHRNTINGNSFQSNRYAIALNQSSFNEITGNKYTRQDTGNLIQETNSYYNIYDQSTVWNGDRIISISDPLSLYRCDDAWDAQANVITAADTDFKDHMEGTASSSLTIAAAFTTGLVATEERAAVNMSAWDKVGFWIKSDSIVAANVLELMLDDTAACASPLETLSIPALTANDWQYVELTLNDPSLLTAIVSVGINADSDPGAILVLIDDITTEYPSMWNDGSANKLSIDGDVLIQSRTDATTGVQILDNAGNVVTEFDTLNQRVGVGYGTPITTMELHSEAVRFDSSWKDPYSEGLATLDSDATNAIVSDDVGTWGSVIDLTEMDVSDATDFDNKWTIARQTAGTGDGSLHFIYGTNADFTANPSWVKFEAAGNVVLAGDLAVNGGDITSTGDLTLDPAGNDVWLDDANFNIKDGRYAAFFSADEQEYGLIVHNGTNWQLSTGGTNAGNIEFYADGDGDDFMYFSTLNNIITLIPDKTAVHRLGMSLANFAEVWTRGIFSDDAITMYPTGKVVFDSNSDVQAIRIVGADAGNDYADIYVDGDGDLHVEPTHGLVVLGNGVADLDYGIYFAGEDSQQTIYGDESDDLILVSDEVRADTSLYRRYYHLGLASFDPGASGAVWTSAGANTVGGWQLDNAAEELETKVDVHSDWDGVTDVTVELRFQINAASAENNTVDIDVVSYYMGVAETGTKTQTITGSTNVGLGGAKAQFTMFEMDVVLPYDTGGAVIDAGDCIGLTINLNTGASEVDDIILNAVTYHYNTTHVGIESGDT